MVQRLERGTFESFKQRLLAIRPDTRPQWGRLTPAGVMAHLRYTLEVSLGEVNARDTSNFLMRTLGRILAFHVFTRWPGGVFKSPPEWTPEPDSDFEAERDKTLAAMERFVNEAGQNPTRKTISPLLGPITLDYWQRVHGIHMAHHFRQFGV